jgi:hypothetical protein
MGLISLVFTIVIIIVIYVAFYTWYAGNKDQICQLPLIGGSLCACPDDYEQDLNGQCYSCPTKNGYKTTRNANGITSPSACDGGCEQMYPGGFESGLLSGQCYSCPPGYTRTAFTDVDASDACSRECPEGTFADPTVPGCWSCGSRTSERTGAAVDGPSACGVPGEVGYDVRAVNNGSNVSYATNEGPRTFPAETQTDSFTSLDKYINAPKDAFDKAMKVPKEMWTTIMDKLPF